MIIPGYFEDLQVLHENTMPPRAYYIPASGRMEDPVMCREESDRVQMLCGKWRFRYCGSIHAWKDAFYEPGYDISAYAQVDVPGVWQMAGYEKNILYHYTDFQALDGILRCAQLRVNNVLRMNDSAEMRHFMDRLCAAVAQRLEEDGDREGAGQVRQRFREELKKEYSAFAACFSFHRDDAAQWERYGNRGRGVCIAFQRELLEKMATGALSLQMVFYRNDMAGHPMVEEFCRLFKEGADLSGEEVRRAMCEAWACSVSYKHPSFRSEYEMRLVVSPFDKEDLEVQPCYHVSKERVKKYYPLPLREMCQRVGASLEDLVAEIIIGPESTQSLAILRDYLRDNGLAPLAENVSLSDCPLRGMPV